MTGNKIMGYWYERSVHVDSVGQAYREYVCSACGFVTFMDGRKACPICKTNMLGVRRER